MIAQQRYDRYVVVRIAICADHDCSLWHLNCRWFGFSLICRFLRECTDPLDFTTATVAALTVLATPVLKVKWGDDIMIPIISTGVPPKFLEALKWHNCNQSPDGSPVSAPIQRVQPGSNGPCEIEEGVLDDVQDDLEPIAPEIASEARRLLQQSADLDDGDNDEDPDLEVCIESGIQLLADTWFYATY